MSTFVNTVDVVGDEALTASIIDRSISEIKDGVLTKIGEYAFSGCKNLKTAVFPAVKLIEAASFNKCSALTMVDFHVLYGFDTNNVFNGCSKLSTLIVRSTTLCALQNKNNFSGTPIASGTGYIYVPRALLSDEDANKDYRRATNWSAYAAQFRALEDFTVDGTITGELDPTKI